MPVMITAMMQAAAHLLVAAAAGWLGARAAKAVRVPEFAGPVLIGLVLGVGVLGRIAPEMHDWLLGDGIVRSATIGVWERQREADRRVLEETGVTETALVEFDGQTQSLRGGVEADEKATAAAGAMLLVALIGPVVLAAGLTGPSWSAKTLGAALPVSLGATLGPALGAAAAGLGLVASGWVDYAGSDATVWVAALAVAAAGPGIASHPQVPYGFAAGRIAVEDEGDRRVGFLAAMVVLVGALALMAPRFLRGGGPVEEVESGRMGVALIQAAPVLAASALLPLGLMLASSGRALRWVVSGSHRVLVPGLVALAASRSDPVADADWLVMIAVLVLFTDVKAIGAASAARGFEAAPWPAALRCAAGLLSDTTFPLAMILMLRGAGLIDGEVYTAVLLAAVLAAMVTPASTRWLASALTGPTDVEDDGDRGQRE